MFLRAQTPGDGQPTDALTRLNERLERGDARLEYRNGVGYLPSLLEHLDINVDSQALVFSKTSFQHAIINPKNLRALYLNDEVAVGNVPGGEVYELLALEPSHGMVFYTLTVRQAERPRLQRRGIECTFCHGIGNSGGLSLVVASVYPDAEGVPACTSSFIRTIDHRTPIAQRWGRWYVTGTHGSQTHMGNAVRRLLLRDAGRLRFQHRRYGRPKRMCPPRRAFHASNGLATFGCSIESESVLDGIVPRNDIC